MNAPEDLAVKNDQYQVVALRYRPQSFESLVGQGHIATALANAIKQNRVGHAYLFTGARGVGKTSSARIFAKCLNCEQGPTTEPCNKCNVCESVSVGEDMDVLEIDGASNRGIDEIRQLRSNVAVRPSRARFKIYIIDEVHMLTQQAFNALLKTLEEPPGHVKFIFCTTDPQKIPITVLSRCQRFDFSPVQTDKIADRLREIAASENVAAEEAALQLLARRANGSMRDSQSLLEQLLSFCGDEITVDEVHQLLGTTDVGKIADLATAMTQRDSTKTLALIHENLSEGVNAGQLAAQLLGYFRDMMVARVGCSVDTLQSCSENELPQLVEQGEKLGLETILMIVQLLDNAVVRMQTSLHGRTLLEVAAVKVCGLEHLESMGSLIKTLAAAGDVTLNIGSGASPTSKAAAKASAPKKNEVNSALDVETNDKPVELAAASPPQQEEKRASNARLTPAANIASSASIASAASIASEVGRDNTALPTSGSQIAVVEQPQLQTNVLVAEAPNETTASAAPTADESISADTASDQLTAATATTIYKNALEAMNDMTANMAQRFEKVEYEGGKMVVTLMAAYNTNLCSKPDRKAKIESAIEQLAGQKIRVDFVTTTNPVVESGPPEPKMSRIQQIRALQEHPFVKEAIDLFSCEISDFHQR